MTSRFLKCSTLDFYQINRFYLLQIAFRRSLLKISSIAFIILSQELTKVINCIIVFLSVCLNHVKMFKLSETGYKEKMFTHSVKNALNNNASNIYIYIYIHKLFN